MYLHITSYSIAYRLLLLSKKRKGRIRSSKRSEVDGYYIALFIQLTQPI